MPRQNREEHGAALAQAKLDGFSEAMRLVRQMTNMGLTLAAVAGALEGQLDALGTEAQTALAAAEASRKPKPDAEPA